MGHLHHEGFSPYTGEFPDLPFLLVVTARFPDAGARTGENGGGRERPPLFAARSGRGGVAQFTFAQRPLGGVAPRLNYPCGKATIDTPGGQGGTHERPRHPRGTDGDPQEAGGRETPRPPRLPLSGLRLSELPERLLPLQLSLQGRVSATLMSFERTGDGCGNHRKGNLDSAGQRRLGHRRRRPRVGAKEEKAF